MKFKAVMHICFFVETAVNRKIRVHPIQFFRFLRPFIFVLVFPTLRRGVQFLLTGGYDFFLPAEVALTVTVICFCIFKTRNFSIVSTKKFLHFYTGKMLKRQTALKISHISQTSLNFSVFDRIFGTATLKIRTGARLKFKPDIVLTLKRENALFLAQILGIK